MSPVNPAPIQLADLAAVMRPDWQRADLEGAIGAARTAGWSWPKVFAETARLLADPDAQPRDLAAAARDPLKRGPARELAQATDVGEWEQMRQSLVPRQRGDGAS